MAVVENKLVVAGVRTAVLRSVTAPTGLSRDSQNRHTGDLGDLGDHTHDSLPTAV
jgi:hypothetical protein